MKIDRKKRGVVRNIFERLTTVKSAPYDPRAFVGKSIKFICVLWILFISITSPIVCHARNCSLLLTTILLVLLFLPFIIFNQRKKVQLFGVSFYLAINILTIYIDANDSAEPFTRALTLFYLLALIFYIFEERKIILFCLGIVLFRIILLGINYGELSATSNAGYTSLGGVIIWIVNVFVLMQILLLFFLFNAKEHIIASVGEKKAFLYRHMSHDVEKAFSAASMLVGQLQFMNEGGLVSKEGGSVVEDLAGSVEFCSYILDNFLDYSRADSMNASFLQNGPIDLFEEVARIIELYKPLSDKKNIAVELLIADGFPKMITSDKIKVCRIVLNLLSNAVRHTPANSLVRVNIEELGKSWGLSVYNQGHGLSQEDADSLLSAKPIRISQEERLGMGIPITKFLVGVLGGKIEVVSSRQGGTSFRVTIPFAHE